MSFRGLVKYDEYYQWDSSGIYCVKKVIRKNIYQYKPITLSYKLPLIKGQSWEWKGQEITKKKIIHSTLSGYVVGDEQVTVPAGTFICKKIRFRYHDEEGTVFIYDQWLAKDVGMVQTIGRIKGKGFFGLLAKLGGGKFIYKLVDYKIQ